MANIWQYATLSAGERLSRIRAGETDIYTQEIARSSQVIKDRQAVGLDISEQLAWIKKLDYVMANSGPLTAEEINFGKNTGTSYTPTIQASLTNSQNTSTLKNYQAFVNAQNNTASLASSSTSSQIDSNNIGNVITSGANVPTAPQLTPFNPSSYIGDNYANYEQELKAFMESQQTRRNELEATLKQELNDKYGIMDSYYKQMNDAVESDVAGKKSDYYANAVSRLPSMYEKFANSGLSFDGGMVRSEQMAYNNALNKSLATLDAQAINAVNANNLSKATEKSKAYSEYTGKLAQENTRLDDMQYQMMRDLQDNAFKQNQFAWEQYKYSSQYDFDKYKYEQQLRETAEQKTLEQLRWEKEFGFKLDSFEFDKLLKQNQIALETDKYMFDIHKYEQEYALKQQDYDLKLKQYADDLYFKQQDSTLKSQEFALKVDLAEFNKMLDNLKYTFDVEKFEKEYALKQSAQNFDSQKFDFDIEKFYAEYEYKQQQSDRDYDYKVQQSATQSAQWEREMALKELVQKSNMTQSEKDYALKYLELEKKYAQTAASSNTSNKSSTSNSSTASTSSANSSSSTTTSPSTSGNTGTTASLYETALTTAMWMKTQYINNGKNTTRKFTNNDIDNWINTLPLTAAEKAKLRKAIGI